ncbi:hypothetical protein GCM10011490_00410 [Pseudoclavibacter endophyticus]|nr:hypothetical protein GCM10011490_00410 [Pseudoclavibacter endophyticus]
MDRGAGPGPAYLDPGSGGPENDFTNRNTHQIAGALADGRLRDFAHSIDRVPAKARKVEEEDTRSVERIRTERHEEFRR